MAADRPTLDGAGRIVLVHPSSELYGSDRSFLTTIEALLERAPADRLLVLLGGEGPLGAAIEGLGVEVRSERLWILSRAGLKGRWLRELARLPAAFAHALRLARGAELLYINTIVPLNFLLAARFARQRIVHVREIPRASEAGVFSLLLRLSGAMVLFNSRATGKAYALPASQPSAVIYNGVKGPPASPPADDADRVRLLVPGRINGWKGQDLVAEALALVSADARRRVDVLFVGGTVPGQDGPLDHLQERIKALGPSANIELRTFEKDMAPLYAWCDLTVVPSRRPEPFGRVAIEAMACARPVLAADHGGLSEIVEDGVTGWLFAPNDPVALAQRITTLALDKPAIRRAGALARARFERLFTEEAYAAAVAAAFDAERKRA